MCYTGHNKQDLNCLFLYFGLLRISHSSLNTKREEVEDDKAEAGEVSSTKVFHAQIKS